MNCSERTREVLNATINTPNLRQMLGLGAGAYPGDAGGAALAWIGVEPDGQGGARMRADSIIHQFSGLAAARQQIEVNKMQIQQAQLALQQRAAELAQLQQDLMSQQRAMQACPHTIGRVHGFSRYDHGPLGQLLSRHALAQGLDRGGCRPLAATGRPPSSEAVEAHCAARVGGRRRQWDANGWCCERRAAVARIRPTPLAREPFTHDALIRPVGGLCIPSSHHGIFHTRVGVG